MLVAVLQSYDQFTIPAISPAVWNVVIIVLLVILRPHYPGGYEDGNQTACLRDRGAGGDVRAAAAGGRRAAGGSTSVCSCTIDWHDPRISQVFTLMLPVTIGLGIVNLDQLINSVFGTLVSNEAPRAIDNAFRIYMLPQGLFSVAVATVLFPTLSRHGGEPRRGAMRRAVGNGHAPDQPAADPRGGVHGGAGDSDRAAGVPARALQRATRRTWSRSRCSGSPSACPFGGLNLLLTRTFFAVQRPWIPTRLAAMNIVVDIDRQRRAVQAARDRRA